MSQPPAVPDCRTPDEVAAYLSQLRTWAGGVSFRELTVRVNAIRQARGVRQTARQTVNDCFARGRRRLDRDLVLDIARALGLDETRLLRLEQACQVADGRRSIATLADVTDGIPLGRKEFTGREKLLDVAVTAVDSARRQGRPPVVMFTGAAGIGKTELAVQLAHLLLDRDSTLSRQFFVDLHGFDTRIEPSPAEEVFATLLKLLGIRDPAIVAMSGLDKRRSRLCEALSTQRAVLVLDNVADAVQLERTLPRTPDCVVLATSQQRLPGSESVTALEVGPLPYHSCVELLERFDTAGRVRREPGVAIELINELCGRRPFDLVALGGQLSDPEEASWSLADHAQRLKQFPLDETSHRILAGSCHRLAPEIRRVFRLLGLYPGYDFSAHDIAVLADLNANTAQEFLNALHDRHLLVKRHAHRYRLHGVVAAYARRLLHREESSASQRSALRRLYTATTLGPIALPNPE
ncbi:MAG: NB-ARC domain-containing protein [Stackebrandtia sp.]